MPAPDQVVVTAGVGGVSALVADPVVSETGSAWQVGACIPPSVPDATAVRAARLEARLTVYAQYAAVVAEEAAAAVAGDDVRRAALSSERGAAEEHFAELRDAADPAGGRDFAEALTDALHELRYQDAIDEAFGWRLRALGDAVRSAGARPPAPRSPAPALPAPALPPGDLPGPGHPTSTLDLRF
ncbi:MAG TPA: hypothetical protein VGD56_04215 [Gemmatirosa sp.]